MPDKRPATREDKDLLAKLAAKIERVGEWPEGADKDETLARLLAVHGDLLDQVLAEPVEPELVPDPAPSIVPDALATLDAPPAAASEPLQG